MTNSCLGTKGFISAFGLWSIFEGSQKLEQELNQKTQRNGHSQLAFPWLSQLPFLYIPDLSVQKQCHPQWAENFYTDCPLRKWPSQVMETVPQTASFQCLGLSWLTETVTCPQVVMYESCLVLGDSLLQCTSHVLPLCVWHLKDHRWMLYAYVEHTNKVSAKRRSPNIEQLDPLKDCQSLLKSFQGKGDIAWCGFPNSSGGRKVEDLHEGRE